ncbi:MAG: hypothetical protein JWN43_1426 [Gammaproteobacteria bacterium]|nr:hypothetical protein [Gammaproteobacteria bacterium]
MREIGESPAVEMRRSSPRALFSLGGTGLLMLAACAASPPARDSQLERAPADGAVTDASYDWHGLVLAPFGTLLKDSPVGLHEVLLFHDESHGAGEPDGKDCYSVDGASPRFVGRQTVEYLLCFDHDRLNRIEASVHLPAAEAAQVFARACALWLKKSAPVAAAGDACEGHDGAIGFSAHLDPEPGNADVPLTMTLSNGSAARDTGSAAQHEK